MTIAEGAPDGPSLSTASAAPAGVPGVLDRNISPISGRLGGGTAAKAVTLAALAAGCGVFFLATNHHGVDKAKGPEDPAAQVVPFEPAKPGATPPTLADPGGVAPSLTGRLPVGPGGSSSQTPPAAASAQAAAQAAAQAKAAEVQAMRAAPIMAFNGGGGGGGGLGALAKGALTGVGTPSAQGDSVAHAATEFDQLRQGSTIGLARANRLPDRRFLITAGTSIPCTLQTAMDTAAPGYVACLVGGDIYSDDGSVILMDKGTRVLGEYRSGLRQGQGRLFVLWTRAVTPTGVAIGLASPASDALGRAGFDGTIDTHFWDRFGGALLLSIVDDTSAAVATRADPNGETVRVPSEAAGVALQNSINIPPTLRKAQGSEVSIFVAQDLDFSTVYALKAR